MVNHPPPVTLAATSRCFAYESMHWGVVVGTMYAVEVACAAMTMTSASKARSAACAAVVAVPRRIVLVAVGGCLFRACEPPWLALRGKCPPQECRL